MSDISHSHEQDVSTLMRRYAAALRAHPKDSVLLHWAERLEACATDIQRLQSVQKLAGIQAELFGGWGTLSDNAFVFADEFAPLHRECARALEGLIHARKIPDDDVVA